MLRIGILGSALLLLYGGLATWQPESALSPGRLLEGHAEIAARCFECHAPFGGAQAARCAACHRVEEIGLETVAGTPLKGPRRAPFHGRLREASCAACHTDHAGPGANGTEAHFEHALLARSDREACVACHERETPDDVVHAGVGATCSACHATAAWRPASFEHERYFRFDRHHPAECQGCHTMPGDLAAYTCYGCHEHSPRRIRSEHLEEGIREFEACERCHRSADEHEAERAWRSLRSEARGLPGPTAGRRVRKKHESSDEDSDSD